MSKIIGTPQMIKLLNKDIIVELIKKSGAITKPDIAKKTKLSLVTVNKAVDELLSENQIKVSGFNESTGGRRALFYEYNNDLNYYIGLYYYKNSYISAISNAVGDIIYQETFPVRTNSWELSINDTYTVIDNLLGHCSNLLVTAVGLGVPGVVNDGIVTSIPTIPNWEGKNLKEILENRYHIQFLLENDINLTTLGIYHSKYKNNVSNLAYVYLEQGIGAGLIINRKLYQGTTNFSGEVCFLPITSSQDKKGNFEQSISHINQLLETSESSQNSALRYEFLEILSKGLLSIICIVNPEILVLKHRQLNQNDILYLTSMLEEYIDSKNIPQIILEDDLSRSSIKGVIDMCISETTFVYSLSNEKRR